MPWSGVGGGMPAGGWLRGPGERLRGRRWASAIPRDTVQADRTRPSASAIPRDTVQAVALVDYDASGELPLR